MNMVKSIWMLITGMNREVDQINAKLDLLRAQQSEILDILKKVQAELSPPPAVALVIQLGGVTQGENGMLQVADNGSVLVTLEADDALGNAGAVLDAPPVITVSDPSLASVNAAADGMSAVLVLTGKLGTLKVHAEAAAGGKALVADSDDVQIVPGAAALLKVSLSAQ